MAAFLGACSSLLDGTLKLRRLPLRLEVLRGSMSVVEMIINTLSILPVEEMIDRLSAIKVVITIKLVIITMHMILTAPFTAKVIATADSKGDELRPKPNEDKMEETGGGLRYIASVDCFLTF